MNNISNSAASGTGRAVRWGLWALVVVAAVAVTLVVWRQPIEVKIGSLETPVECVPLVESDSTDLWPYQDAVNAFVEENRGSFLPDSPRSTFSADQTHALTVVLNACEVARDNRETRVLLTAVVGATLVLLVRPRSRR